MDKHYFIRVNSIFMFLLFLLTTMNSVGQEKLSLQKIQAGQQDSLKWLKAWEKVQVPKDYRSPGKLRKFFSTKDIATQKQFRSMEKIQVFDYNSKQLILIDTQEFQKLSQSQQNQLNIRDDMNLIILRDRLIDTTVPEPAVPQDLRFVATRGKHLQLVQFVGPGKEQWLRELKRSKNVKIVNYIPNNGYLLWGDEESLSQIRTLKQQRNFIQWIGSFHPVYKIHPSFDLDYDGGVTATIQLVTHSEVNNSIKLIKSKSSEILRDTYIVGPYSNIVVKLPAGALVNIAKFEDVVNIEPWIEPQLFGERQGQILANQLNAAGSQPTGPGYLSFLNGLGFNTTFDFVVNVSDGGFDRGQITAANIHPDFLDAAGNSRMAYVQQVSGTTIDTTPANNNDTGGHGTINLAIVGGFNNQVDTPSSGTDFEDAAGFNYGLGIAPFVQLGSSRIFNPGFTFPDHTELTNAAYRKGARISSNSWGSNCRPFCCSPGVLGSYTADSQEFDYLVRDARPNTALDGGAPGNQQMVIVFSSGNEGTCSNEQLGNNGSTAKNTFVVGAGENFNQGGLDGCGVTNAGANDIRDVINFSSAGPTQDNRFKPDIMAPGTHIFGAASQDPGYTGATVCDQYFQAGQTLYAWSSGTSHSTPAVAGGCALLRQWFIMQGKQAPSPAMTKAYLMNSTTYMTGTRANDTLPSNVQGMGRLNLERSFDAVPRILVDQTKLFTMNAEEYKITGKVPNSSEPFRVTLAWTDVPGNPNTGIILVNDLDLEVKINGDPDSYWGNNFTNNISQVAGTQDRDNNVESVFLPAGRVKEFTVIVHAANIVGEGVPNNDKNLDQDFALVVYNGKKVTRKFSVSFHTGTAIPAGSFTNNFDPGFNTILDVGYRLSSQFSIVGLFGYNAFNSKVANIDDTYWINLSLNLKHHRILRLMPFPPIPYYICFGPGYYIPKSGDGAFGGNVGFGFNYEYNSRVTFELGTDYHKVFDEDVQFMHSHVGVIFHF